MPPLLDLEKLHKKYRKQKIRNIFLSCIALMIVASGGALALSHHKLTNTPTQVYGLNSGSDNASPPTTNLSPSTSPSSTVNLPSSNPTSNSSPNLYTPSITMPSSPTISIPNSSYTPSYSSPTYTTPPSTYSPPSCPQLGDLTQQLIRAENQLSNDENASQSSAGGYGLTGAQLQSYWNSIIAQDKQVVNTAQQQINSYKQQTGC